ncbi:MAG TPA: hypothetical protein DEP46_06260 [Blastocatellia bacterium]|nr:hypothetical protein [Blastocatellia bacterium]
MSINDAGFIERASGSGNFRGRSLFPAAMPGVGDNHGIMGYISLRIDCGENSHRPNSNNILSAADRTEAAPPVQKP